MNYFVAGTDTGVGKTLISCALLHGFAARGQRAVGMKPVAAGCDAGGHNEDALKLQAAGNVALGYGQINPYCFVPAIAPHLAAQRAGVIVQFSRIAASYKELAAQSDVVIVEGAGGLLVPLNDEQDSADLVKELGLPIILVAGMRLPESCAAHCGSDRLARPGAGGLGGQYCRCRHGVDRGKCCRAAAAHRRAAARDRAPFAAP